MPRRDCTKERRWRRLLRLWRHSGLTVRDFCAQHGLAEPSFYAWRSEVARRDQQGTASGPVPGPRGRAPAAPTTPPPAAAASPAFLRVALAPAGERAPVIEVIARGGRRLRVPPGFDADLLRQLLRLVEEPPC
jgi:transposase-like protein